MREYLYQLLETTGGDLSGEVIVLRLAVSVIIAAFIFLSYRLSHSGSVYSAKFNVSLAALTIITTTVMIVIGNNIVLSLGMVGALSIVRFRTAVKDPLDTAYMFWALTMGILLGAGLYLIAVIVVLCIAILMFVISFAKLTTPNAYLLVVHYDEFCEAAIQSELNRSVRSSKLRAPR